MLKKWRQFNESNNTNDDYFIIDAFDTEGDGYVEYMAYGKKDKKFYFLDPDYDIISGPIDHLDQLMTLANAKDENYDEYLNKIKNIK